MNPFQPMTLEKNGRLWTLHFRNRHDPVTLAVVATAAGTGMQVMGKIQEGKTAEKIGEQRAAVDRMNAQQVFDNAKTEADILAEKRTRLIATQKNQAAAGGIRIDSPVVGSIEEETRRVIGLDISNILNQGRQQKNAYLQSAGFEEAVGKNARKQSIWDAVGTGLMGAGSIANMGMDAGWGSKTPTKGFGYTTGYHQF